MKEKVQDKERFFSVELESKANLKNVTLTSDSNDGVLVEGTIGELMEAAFAEGVILEIVGRSGTLRINLKPNELKKSSHGSVAGKKVVVRKNGSGEVR
jgi:hypothetical protein